MTNDLPDALIEKVARAMRKALEETFADTDNSDCFKDRALPSTKSAWMDIASKTALSIIQPELDKRDAIIEAATALLNNWLRYKEGDQNFEQAYYALAKYSYNDWEALEAALKTTTGHDNNTEKRGRR